MTSRQLDIPIKERLAKLLRMLSSDNDGELVNAARAIQQTLKANGADIHTLAGLVTAKRKQGLSEKDMRRAYREGFDDGLRHVEADAAHDLDDNVLSWREIAKFCEARSDRLKPHEQDFVEQMVRWTRLGREPTERQARWLDYLYTRLKHRNKERTRYGRRRQS